MGKLNYCPECNEPLLPGVNECSSCKWRAPNVGASTHTRPVLGDLKSGLLNILNAATMDHPAHAMPTHAETAVAWFLNLVEPEHRTERPQQVSGRGKQASSWRWPYAERVQYLMRVYLGAPIELQQLVVAAREDGIFWRGDDYVFFVRVIDETEKMRELGLDEYRRQSRKAMGRLNLGADR